MRKRIEDINKKWKTIVLEMHPLDFKDLEATKISSSLPVYNPMDDYVAEIIDVLKEAEAFKLECVDFDYYDDAEGYYIIYAMSWVKDNKLDMVTVKFETAY